MLFVEISRKVDFRSQVAAELEKLRVRRRDEWSGVTANPGAGPGL
jgi:hypothetical protein